MKTYQKSLPLATSHKLLPPRLAREIAASLKTKISKLFYDGFWFCNSCLGRCERVEGENGQPARCSLCGSYRLEYCRAGQIPEGKFLEEPKEAA